MKPKLTIKDYQKAAKELNCEVAAIRAVAEVESLKGGFLPDGRPKILFERHVFHQRQIEQQEVTDVLGKISMIG